MKGNPRYRKGDTVSFQLCRDVICDRVIKAGTITGTVEIVDAYGAIGCSDVSYDVYDAKNNMLWKHIEEKALKKLSE